jgi:6-phosphogluconate dehydrogenase
LQIGIVGLGRMGGNMARRLASGGHEVIGYDLDPATAAPVEADGVRTAASVVDLVNLLEPPRSVWTMLPAGEPTESVLTVLADLLDPGDTAIDGGNAYYKDSMRRARELDARGVRFMDVGISGGIWGRSGGYSLMVGGNPELVEQHRDLFATLAPGPDLGWGHVGPVGAGHYVKMVHNAVEYGLMQAYAEGFDLLTAKTDFDLDVHQVAEIWRYGSVVRSWLLDLIADLMEDAAALDDVRGWVPDTGEGRWAVAEAIDLNVSLPVITASLERRLRSRQSDPFSDRLLAALRGKFGGHEVARRLSI